MGKGLRLTLWLLLTVGVGLVPPFLNVVVAGISGDPINRTTILPIAFGHGELLMVSVGLAAGVIGNLLLNTGDWSGLKAATIAFCFVLGVAATGAYGSVLFAQAIEFQVAGGWLAVVSLIPYGISVAVSGFSTAAIGR